MQVITSKSSNFFRRFSLTKYFNKSWLHSNRNLPLLLSSTVAVFGAQNLFNINTRAFLRMFYLEKLYTSDHISRHIICEESATVGQLHRSSQMSTHWPQPHNHPGSSFVKFEKQDYSIQLQQYGHLTCHSGQMPLSS